MGLSIKPNKANRELLRLGPLSSLRLFPKEFQPAGFRRFLIAATVFLFELSLFVNKLSESPNWFQFLSRNLNKFVAAMTPGEQATQVPEALVDQWGDGVLGFLFVLNLVVLHPASMMSKVTLVLFTLANVIFVHAASIAFFLSQGWTAISRLDQLVIAAPCALITCAGFLWWSSRQS
jgi:hypothetical protein